MSDAEVRQAAHVVGPWQTSTLDSTVVIFTAATTHKCNAIPDNFKGKFVRMIAIGGNVHWFFTSESAAEVDRAAAASDAGTTGVTVGSKLTNGQERHTWVPSTGATVYFAREADTTCSVGMELASD